MEISHTNPLPCFTQNNKHKKEQVITQTIRKIKEYKVRDHQLFPEMSSRLVIITVSMRLLRKISAISAARLISFSLSSGEFIATLATEIWGNKVDKEDKERFKCSTFMQH